MSKREESAVREWFESPKDFHIMRDGGFHDSIILAGLWGAKLENPETRKNWTRTWDEGMNDTVMWASRNETESDQSFLKRFLGFNIIINVYS